MPLHRHGQPPLVGAVRAAAGATADDAPGQADATAEDHGDVRNGH